MLDRLIRPALAPTLFACLVMVTACDSDQSDRPPAPRESVTSRFVTGQPGAIETVVVDPLPVTGAVLKLPGGQMLAYASIQRDSNVYSDDTGYGPNVGVRVAGGSAEGVHTGIGIGFPLFGGGGENGVKTSAMTTSTIRFKVPDMTAYRRDWQSWILHLDLSDGANSRVIETLPPAPPRE